MKLISRAALLLLTYSLSAATFSWNALGHMLIAQIAYQHLNPNTQKQVDTLIEKFQLEYPDITMYMQAAAWPDAIRGQNIETYTHWHYIDYAISTDGSSLKNLFDTDNSEWAIHNIIPVVKNAKANPFERVRFLAFLTHIVGDMHQPLHSVSNITAKNPNGDRGGNDYYVYVNKERINLHRLWDGGVGSFSDNATPDQVIALASRIQQTYPESSFGNKVNDLNPADWSKENINLALQNVYSTPEEQAVSNNYIQTNQVAATQQVALAGYRLAKLLNSLF